jgi:hypothetical protein
MIGKIDCPAPAKALWRLSQDGYSPGMETSSGMVGGEWFIMFGAFLDVRSIGLVKERHPIHDKAPA